MKREILFRAKCLKRKIWVQGGYTSYMYDHFRKELRTKEHIIMTKDYGDIIHVEPNTLGEFTNLYDKNGKYLWERDIARYTFNHHGIKVTFEGVICHSCSFDSLSGYSSSWGLATSPNKLKIFNYDFKPSDCELLGNLVDNPELIKNSEQFGILF